MIRSFSQSWLAKFYHDGNHKKVSSQLSRPVLRKLTILDSTESLEDLKSPPGNHLHALHRDREEQYTISVNGPWRLCFGFQDGDVFDIELVQYH